jgi:hypothetical protein
MAYEPKPIDTSMCKIPGEISELTEVLAKNTHEIWAARRMAEGWTHGSERNDHAKRHPGLVPYELLPDAEREYDRVTAMETLKLIMALGYRIEKR